MGVVFTDCGIDPQGEVPEVYAVPAHIDGQIVTQIGARAFYGRRGLRLVVLPETITSIGEYAFAECRELEKIVFGAAVSEIGNYCFYNCMGLKEISYGAGLTEIGYGAFKNCMDLKRISLDIAEHGTNCLNAILLDEFQEIEIRIRYLGADGGCLEEARLIFTDYQYEYVPQIEARQFNWESYGSGESYRVSIRDTDIDYEKYDSVFPVAMLEDDEDTLFRIAAGRLCWPYKLSVKSRQRYEDYLRAHMDEVLDRITAQGQKSEMEERLFDYLLDQKILDPQEARRALMLAQRRLRSEMTARLMQYLGESGIKEKKRGRFML